MAKDKDRSKKKDRDQPAAAKAPGERGTAAGASGARHDADVTGGGQHHAAKAHGRPTQVDESLPGTRPELMELHAAARARRNGADLDSPAFRAAVMDIERIEIRIAAIDRAADPPLG
jgi:hypothetical protein